MFRNPHSNAVHKVGISPPHSPRLCLQLSCSFLSFSGIWLSGGEEGDAHLVSVLYEADVYICNCGYGWLNSRCPSGSPACDQSASEWAAVSVPWCLKPFCDKLNARDATYCKIVKWRSAVCLFYLWISKVWEEHFVVFWAWNAKVQRGFFTLLKSAS